MTSTEFEKLYLKAQRANIKLYDKVTEKMAVYDNNASQLSKRVINNLDKQCMESFENMKDYHIKNNLSLKQNSQLNSIYQSCKRFYSNNTSEFLNFNNNKFEILLFDYANNMKTCEQNSNEKTIRECYERQSLKHLLKMDEFLNEVLNILGKKEEYVIKAEKYKFKDMLNSKDNTNH